MQQCLRDHGHTATTRGKYDILLQYTMCLLAQLVHHSTELGHAKTNVLVLQNVLVFPHYMPGCRGVVIDLQPIRPQIYQLIDRAIGTLDYEPVHYNLHLLQTTPVL